MTQSQKMELSLRLRSCAKHFPKEFQRKPRGVEDLDLWKATEYRNFLMYVGPVVLNGILQDELYNHFLCLFVAARILASPTVSPDQCDYAEQLLEHFSRECTPLYGAHSAVYNMHSIIHLANECKVHGHLDSFSAFAFESHLGKIKELLRSKNNPLAQLSHQLSEGSQQQLSQTQSRQCNIESKSTYILRGGAPVYIEAVKGSEVCYVSLPRMRDFFAWPLESTKLSVLRTDKAGTLNTWRNATILKGAKKCLKLDYKSGHVVMPLMHLH